MQDLVKSLIEPSFSPHSYQSVWNQLNTIDRAVYTWILANGSEGIYSDHVLANLSLDAQEPMTKDKLQNSLRRLIKARLINKGRRAKYTIADQRFREWYLNELVAID